VSGRLHLPPLTAGGIGNNFGAVFGAFVVVFRKTAASGPDKNIFISALYP
jgi:ABC-type branched-subunit amino acid transport system permease subunit